MMLVLLVILPALVAALARDEAVRRGYSTRQSGGNVVPTPYLFFYKDSAACTTPGISVCRGELANYDNQIQTFTMQVSAVNPQNGAHFVNYPTSIQANDRHGACDTHAIAGYLGFDAVRIQKSSANWTDLGNTGYLMSINNPAENNVLVSCGFMQNAPDKPYPDCPTPPSFYQLVSQFAYTGVMNVSVTWTITSIDQNVYTGVSTCLTNPNQPNFTTQDSQVTTTTTLAPTTTTTTTLAPTTTTTTLAPTTTTTTLAPTTTTTTTLIPTTSTSTTTTIIPTTSTSTTTTIIPTTLTTTSTTTLAPTTSPNCQANLYNVCDYLATRPCCSSNARCARHFKGCSANVTGILGQSNWLCIPQ